MMEIYLDNAAGTKIDNEVLNIINEAYKQFYGNPSSLHYLGEKSLDYLNLQKEKISKILNCKPSELIFTSTGTESINLAIKGFINSSSFLPFDENNLS